MASLPGMPGSLGMSGGSGFQQPSGTPLGSDLSLDLPNPNFVAPTFNQWPAVLPDGYPFFVSFPVGIDAALKRTFFAVYTSDAPAIDLLTFDFSFGAPGSPSRVACALHSSFSALLSSSDALDDFWGFGYSSGTPPHLELESFSISSGTQISATDTLSPVPPNDYLPVAASSFSVGGLAQMAVWYSHTDGHGVFLGHLLQVNDVSSGTPVEVASIDFPNAGDDDHDVPMDAGVFYDGVGALWTNQVTLSSGDSSVVGCTLTKFAVPAYASIGSASFAGAYGFVGDSCSGHIYLLNIDGSVSDVDPLTFATTIHPGLSSGIASIGQLAFSTAPPQFFPIWALKVTRAMMNPIYGMSTDPVTSQFFMQGPSLNTYTRVQDFAAVDTFELFSDWGLDALPSSDPIWIPSEQAMLIAGNSGSSFAWYELIYPTLQPFCEGETVAPGGADVDQFLPNVWIIS